MDAGSMYVARRIAAAAGNISSIRNSVASAAPSAPVIAMAVFPGC